MTYKEQRITERPWRGRCATTGLTMDEFAALLEDVIAPDWVTRAAVSITRSYATVLTNHRYTDFPVADLARKIDNFRLLKQSTTAELMAEFRAAEKLDSPPQYPDEEPWIRECAVAICDQYAIRGLCDPVYIANVIRGQEMDQDQPGERYRRAAQLNEERWKATR